MSRKKNKETEKAINNFFEILATIENKEEAAAFMHDLCTPQEIVSMAERWRVCQFIAQEKFSYRQIHEFTGVSLGTIVRVARSLHDDSFKGYQKILKKIKK